MPDPLIFDQAEPDLFLIETFPEKPKSLYATNKSLLSAAVILKLVTLLVE